MRYTINLIQPKRANSKSSKIPIYLRLYQDGKLIHVNSGIYVDPKYWNDGRQEVRSTHDKHVKYNDELERLKNLAENRALELKRINNLDIRLIRDFLQGGGSKDLIEYAEDYRKEVKANGRYWEHRQFKVIINDLKGFLGSRVLNIGAIDSGFIEDFQNYLLNRKKDGKQNNPNTTRRKLRRLKGMFRHALKRKVINRDPFQAFDLVKAKPAERVKLSIYQIKAIEGLSLKRGSSLWHIRSYFLYSFYNAGIRFSDLCTLTWGNLVDGRLKYEMHKTAGRKSIRQIAPMYRILLQYVESPGELILLKPWTPYAQFYLRRPDDTMDLPLALVVKQYASKHTDDYIFPILDRKYSNLFTLKAKISSKNVIVNRGLKEIADLAGIDANISFHVSRHSFGHYALKEGLGVYEISKALGHSKLSTTEQYLRAFDEELLDKGMKQIFS